MEDSVRPSQASFKAMYERGYQTWAALWDQATTDNDSDPNMFLARQQALPDLSRLPLNLAINRNFVNVATATGATKWTTAPRNCGLPSFEHEVNLIVAQQNLTSIVITPDVDLSVRFAAMFGKSSGHVPVLTLAWAYALSARWAETIPGAQQPIYTDCQAPLSEQNDHPSVEQNTSETIIVNIGTVSHDAAQWWAAVLSQGYGWTSTIPNNKGMLLYSPWSTQIEPGLGFVISRSIKPGGQSANRRSASFDEAITYIRCYCRLHGLPQSLSQGALTTASFIPVAKADNRRIGLPVPRFIGNQSICVEGSITRDFPDQATPLVRQIDAMITIGCNPQGIKSLLSSVFFEPDVECNICGAWLQGCFAFLDSKRQTANTILLLRAIINRDPSLGWLWVGAFATGLHVGCLQAGRSGWWKLDLGVAAWFGSHVSFIQEPVPAFAPGTREIQRADEGRLMYLCHQPDHTSVPLFPFGPFGSVAVADLDLDVRQHISCGQIHHLEYQGMSWHCEGGKKVWQGFEGLSRPAARYKTKEPLQQRDAHTVNFEDMEYEDDDASQMVTRNIFTWLREQDGFPVAERAIREHEWIDNLRDDDDSPIEGRAVSTAGDSRPGRWLLDTLTTRCKSL
ncbi:hypothetical protein Micbo1qcDRAFT_213360 [Microdochium bolleyi]|uniref:Uncharacterized protein n=1 Tax=Microdochium bolleyi TaxID=196109 RepID=A0A136IVZ4_9PEZI|nr:hypothetical protein Micbo1qcDRAFT_213360 [Microdochium bolleyi]